MLYKIFKTDVFDQWLAKQKDRQAVKAILLRLARVEGGNLGDVKPVGGGVSEMRIFVGKGYRLYFTTRGGCIVLLLCGGNKSTQDRDIQQAKNIAKEIEE